MLTQLRIFAQSHGIHLWFVAHPTKMMRDSNGKIPAPKGYDISGSAAWFAKADVDNNGTLDKEEFGEFFREHWGSSGRSSSFRIAARIRK